MIEENTSMVNKQALVALRKMRMELQELKESNSGHIAIIGVACRFPGEVNNPEDYRKILFEGEEVITEIPEDRWDMKTYFDPDPAVPGKMYVRHGGFLSNVYDFDYEFFGLSEREAASMDPQQRLLLELSWEALENAGIPAMESRYQDSTGVFIGIATHDYSKEHMDSNVAEDIDIYSFTGSSFSITSGRISYLLGLQGPTITIDTACSSSLVAVHQACQSIKNGEAEIALAGGVNLILHPENTIYFCKTNALSPSGHCRTFDDSADGYVRSEGAGVLVLKRLSHALNDGDEIQAVIRGSAINHDGRSNGLTAPNGNSQKNLLKKALISARLAPDEIDYIETHGTGTPLGDPIEVRALGEVFSGLRNRQNPIYMGSCKTNMGHTEAAAGVAGIIKVILSLKYKKIPPHLHFQVPNSHIDWERYQLRVPQKLISWRSEDSLRRAGVSSFGFSGTNAHIILEEAPVVSVRETALVLEYEIFCFSGKSETRLRKSLGNFREFLREYPDISLKQAAFSLNTGRYHFSHRAVFISNSVEDLNRQLDEYSENRSRTSEETTNETALTPVIGFAFETFASEQISETIALFGNEEVFVRVLEQCSRLFRSRFQISLWDENRVLIPTSTEALGFSLGCAYASLLENWGILPERVGGAGTGHIACACFAGALDLEEGIALAAYIAQKKALKKSIFKEKAPGSLRIGVVSHESGESVLLTQLRDIAYWQRIANQAVPENLTSVLEEKGCTRIIAIGNRKSPLHPLQLLSLLKDFYMTGKNPQWESVYGNRKIKRLHLPATEFFRETCKIQSELRETERTLRGNSLSGIRTSGGARYIHPLLGERIFSSGQQDICFQSRIGLSELPYLNDHGLLGKPILAAAAYLEMAKTAIQFLELSDTAILEDIVFQQGMAFQSGGSKLVQFRLHETDAERLEFEIVSADQPSSYLEEPIWTVHALGAIRKNQLPAPIDDPRIEDVRKQCKVSLSPDSFYEHLEDLGYLFGPANRALVELRRSDNIAIGRLSKPPQLEADFDEYFFHPAFLDACGHVLLSLLPKEQSNDAMFVTLGNARTTFYRRPTGDVVVYAEESERSPSEFRGNLTVFDTDNRPVLRIEGYTMRKISRGSLSFGKGKDASENWLYSLAWKELKRTKSRQTADSGEWLILTEATGPGEEIRNELLERGQNCTLVFCGSAYKQESRNKFYVNPSEPEHFQRLTNTIRQNSDAGAVFAGVLFLWGARDLLPEKLSFESLKAAEAEGCRTLLFLCQALEKTGLKKSSVLAIITRNAQFVDGSEVKLNPGASLLWGAVHSLSLEWADARCLRIDLGSPSLLEEGRNIVDELFNESNEGQIAFRRGKRFVPRLRRASVTNSFGEPSSTGCGNLVLEKGASDEFSLVPRDLPAPGPGEVRIEVFATGLGLYDLLAASELIDASGEGIGLECSGKVAAIGVGVLDLKPGDQVMAFVEGCAATEINVNAHCVVRKPESLSLSEAAAIPTSYLTAYYGLHDVAALQPGRKVLIHSAAGGVGLAAIGLAKALGAEIYATADRSRWEFLRSLGVGNIYDSRTLEFAERILKDTDRKGVDAVLSSLSGEYVSRNFSILKSGGYYLEIGNQRNRPAELESSRYSGINYKPYSIFEFSRKKPEYLQEMLLRIKQLLEEKKIAPLPLQFFAVENAPIPFSSMKNREQVGKPILGFSRNAAPSIDSLSSSSVMITGGTGGLGLEIAKWLVSKRAHTLILVGRKPMDSGITRSLQELKGKESQVLYMQADVADPEQVISLIDRIRKECVPLKGVIHAAGVTDDALFANQTWPRFTGVTAPKIGAWNLHEHTINLSLDFFVLFSSVTSLLGVAGTASYAAGNAFLDTLAHYRRLHDLPALSLNWGPWSDAGLLTRVDSESAKLWKEQGMRPLATNEALEVFEKLICVPDVQLGVFPVQWDKWTAQYLPHKKPSVLIDLVSETVPPETGRTKRMGESKTERKRRLHDRIIEKTREILGLDTLAWEDDLAFQEIGMDYVQVLQLLEEMEQETERELPDKNPANYPTLKVLRDALAELNHAEDFNEASSVDRGETAESSRLRPLVLRLLRKVLRKRPDEEIDERLNFHELGLDSLMSVELRNLLQQALGIALPATMLFNFSNIATIVEYLETSAPAESKTTIAANVEQVDEEYKEIWSKLDSKMKSIETCYFQGREN